MLYQHFVECVFHFNSFEKHKGEVATSVRLSKITIKSQFKGGAMSIYSSVRISWFNNQKLSPLLGYSAAIDLSTDSVRQNTLRVAFFTYFCLFVLVYNKFTQTDREKKLFSLKGDHNSR